MAMDPKPDPVRRFLSVDQVAENLNVKAGLVRGLIKSGQLRAIQVGGRGIWRIGVQDLEDYIQESYSRTSERIAAGDLDTEADGEL